MLENEGVLFKFAICTLKAGQAGKGRLRARYCSG